MAVIILEGADNIGKTTMAKKLLIQLPNYELIHNGKYKYRIQAIFNYLLQIKKDDVIIDRSILSEIIYGAYHRNKRNSKLTDWAARKICKKSYTFILYTNHSEMWFAEKTDHKTDYTHDYEINDIFKLTFWPYKQLHYINIENARNDIKILEIINNGGIDNAELLQ